MPRTLSIPHRTMDDLVAAQEAPAGQVAAPAPALDEIPPSGQSVEIPAPEGELELARSVAKQMGWVPLEEWTRDPAKHVDAPQFLKDTPNQVLLLRQRNAELAERAKRASQAADAILEDERHRARQEALAEARAAAEASDPDKAEAAAKKLAANSGPSAAAQSWVAGREWLKSEPDAWQMALRACDQARAVGLTEAEQLVSADMALRKRFPEYYPAESAPQREALPPEEARLSEIRRPPPVQQGTRTATGPATKEKGYPDLPSDIRHTFENSLLRKFTNRGVPAEQARANYAARYWAETA